MPVYAPRISNARVEPLMATTPSIPLKVKAASLTMDATWSPYLQGSITCVKLPASTAADPRQAAAVKFTLSQELDYGGHVDLAVVASLRSRSTDYQANQTVLTFASIEAVLQDHASIGGNQYATNVTDLQMVTDALANVQPFNDGRLAFDNSHGPAAFTVAQADAIWDPGTAIWDVINGIESTKSIWLHGDESGLKLFRHPIGYTSNSANVQLTRTTNATDTIDRSDPNFADSVFINYVYNKGLSVKTDYGIAGSPIFYKMLVINRTGTRVTGEAQARAERMARRGRSVVVSGPWDLTVRPNRPIAASYRDGAWNGTVRAVTWRYPDAEMDATIDVIET